MPAHAQQNSGCGSRGAVREARAPSCAELWRGAHVQPFRDPAEPEEHIGILLQGTRVEASQHLSNCMVGHSAYDRAQRCIFEVHIQVHSHVHESCVHVHVVAWCGCIRSWQQLHSTNEQMPDRRSMACDVRDLHGVVRGIERMHVAAPGAQQACIFVCSAHTSMKSGECQWAGGASRMSDPGCLWYPGSGTGAFCICVYSRYRRISILIDIVYQ